MRTIFHSFGYRRQAQPEARKRQKSLDWNVSSGQGSTQRYANCDDETRTLEKVDGRTIFLNSDNHQADSNTEQEQPIKRLMSTLVLLFSPPLSPSHINRLLRSVQSSLYLQIV